MEKLADYKFLGVTYERHVSDGRPKSEEEIYAYKVGYNEAIDNITQFAPTADVVEVVRCKDCKFRGHIQLCPFGKRAMPHANGYCCYGERRE